MSKLTHPNMSKAGLDLIQRVKELEDVVRKKGFANRRDVELLKDRVDTLCDVVDALKRAIPHVNFEK